MDTHYKILWVCFFNTTTQHKTTKQNKTKQNKTKQNKTKQNKTKQNKTKQQHNTTKQQHNTTQHNTTQHNTTQHMYQTHPIFFLKKICIEHSRYLAGDDILSLSVVCHDTHIIVKPIIENEMHFVVYSPCPSSSTFFFPHSLINIGHSKIKKSQ
jgi:hypothetical protein